MRARRVTALVLGDPGLVLDDRGFDHAATWMEIAPRNDGVTVVSETFARKRLPAPAIEAMRSEPCFYMCVDDIGAAVAHVPGRRVGPPVVAHGMRELCIETPSGMIVLAERA